MTIPIIETWQKKYAEKIETWKKQSAEFEIAPFIQREFMQAEIDQLRAGLTEVIQERDALRQQLTEARRDAFEEAENAMRRSHGGIVVKNNYTKDAVDFAIDAAMKGAA